MSETVLIRQCGVGEMFSLPEFQALGREYAAECGINGLPPPMGERGTYLALEQSGTENFVSYGAFVGEELVGFLAVISPRNGHYGMRLAVAESLFVSPRWRHTGAGLELIRKAESRAVDVGSPCILLSAPTGSRMEKVISRLCGYSPVGQTFYKDLGVRKGAGNDG